MHWATEELIASEGMRGYLLGLGQYEVQVVSESESASAPAPGPYRPKLKPKPKIATYANIRQLVKQAAQPTGYAPAAITPGLQAALRAKQALITRAPTPVRKTVAHKMPAVQAAAVQIAVAQAAAVPADSNLIASQQQERLLLEKLASNMYDYEAPEARHEAIQKDMTRVMAEAEYQRSAQRAAVPVQAQSLEYGPKAPTAEEMFAMSRPVQVAHPKMGISEFIGTVNAAADIKAIASAWVSKLFGE